MTTQNEVNYTPGPWVWQKDGHLESSENGPVILGGSEENPHGILINKEDANLISAAPEMLKALISLRKAFYVYGSSKALKAAFALTHDVVKKAEGRI